jgi:hypothetical protein
VQLYVRTTDGPTDVETKFHFTPHHRQHIHRHHSDSCWNPSAQIEKRDYTFAVHDVLNLPPDDEVYGCQFRTPWGPIIRSFPADPLTAKSLIQSSAYNDTEMGWSPSCWKMRPATSAAICVNTKLYSISRETALVMVLLWKKGPIIRSDMIPNDMLSLGLSWTYLDIVGPHCPYSANLAVHNTVCMKSGLVEMTWLNDSWFHAVPTRRGAMLPSL